MQKINKIDEKGLIIFVYFFSSRKHRDDEFQKLELKLSLWQKN